MERLIDEIIADLDSKITDRDLLLVSETIRRHMQNYDVKQRETAIVPYTGTIPDCVKTYLVVRKIEGLKMSTLELYQMRLNQFFRMVMKDIKDITTNDIRIFLYQLQQSKNQKGEPISDSTLANARTIICTFFRWACAEGYVLRDPCVNIKPIKYTHKMREPLNEDELEIVRYKCKTLRDRALVEFLFSTGCRVSECINVRIADLSPDMHEVELLTTKGDKPRTAYLSARARLLLKNYLESRDDNCEYLFVSLRKRPKMNLTKDAVEKVLRELGYTADLSRRLHPHLIRHTTATLGLKRGMDVTEIQRILGHVNVNTTMIYAHLAKEQVKTSHEKYII